MSGHTEIERISDETRSAVRRRIATNRTHGLDQSNGGDEHALLKAQKAHQKHLNVLRAAIAKGKSQAISVAKKRLLHDFSSRLMAVARSTDRRKEPLPFTTLETWANKLAVDQSYGETVLIRPAAHGNSWRPVCMSGIRRRQQQLIVRDLLLMLRGDSPCDATVRGVGGEATIFSDVKSAIGCGYRYWVSLDVCNFFPSLRPGHLAGFPLSEWIVRNIVFLPPEAPFRFTDHRATIDLSEEAILNGGEDDQPVCSLYSWGTLRSKVKQVRQGLIQGDVCAPQIARTVLGRELQRTLDNRGVIYGSHIDDVIIGACTRSELKAAIKALTHRLKSHPAGPLDLRHDAIRDTHESAYFLGYRFGSSDDGTVRVRPGVDRFDRFRARLRDRLETCPGITKLDLLRVAMDYAQQWFNAHPAWDRAPTSGNAFSGASWDHLWSEAVVCINQLIHDEWAAGAPWDETEIDFDLLQA